MPKPLFTVVRIARMSELRRSNLQRRLVRRVEDAEAEEMQPSRMGPPDGAGSKALRTLAVLGRFSAITANHPAQS